MPEEKIESRGRESEPAQENESPEEIYPFWEIGPRRVPAPAAVSDILRESLLKTPPPDVPESPGSFFHSDEDWEQWAEEGNCRGVDRVRSLADELSVTIREDTLGGVHIYRVTPPEIDERHQEHLFVFVHGGAWFLNAGMSGTRESVVIAARLKLPVVSVDYRLLPKHPAPAATDDVIAVWTELLQERSPGSMAMGGTSAGANIVLSSVHRFKEACLPVPGAIYLGTPAVDLEPIGDSWSINEGIDRVLISWKHVCNEAAAAYAGEYDQKHPHVSPIYGDFAGFPPGYLITGTRDLLLSDTVRVHRKLRRAGVEADLHVYEGQSHGDYGFVLDAPESAEHYCELKAFLLKHLA